ncbi:hypothetical protein [Desertivirga arenae]|uniref:hypothetical protein n=1 Tax=Desertivirga arenae TaxID=2810309 RepID=UPI001A9584B7|nr:hypothetical protein [Pedobacter sp. SYSU D00823]
MSAIIKKLSNAEIVFLIYYILWWLYLVYWINSEKYDNNPAGGIASVGMGFLTFSIFLLYLISFSIAAIVSRKKRFLYLLIILFLFLPIAVSFLIATIASPNILSLK